MPTDATRRALAAGVILVAALAPATPTAARPVTDATRARLARHEPERVIVEYDAATVDAAAATARSARRLRFDDRAIGLQRVRGYQAVKATVAGAVGAADVARVRDLPHLPLAVWTLRSTEALARLEAAPGVRRVHEDGRVRPVSVSDLPFISAPQAAAAGFTGNGTTIAVIDGGLASNYTGFPDFGTCNGTTLGGSCRVVVNDVFYPGLSTETTHGTNVSAIALGVAPAARLAMFNIFDGGSASSSDILTAMESVYADRTGGNLYSYVALNISLGDGTTNAAQCTDSPVASAVSVLASAGVTTVAAAGNNGQKTGLGDPACAPGVVSVGAVYDQGYGAVGWYTTPTTTCTDSTTGADQVTCFSQSASYLTLLAPGTFVNAPSSAFQQSGTSQATPHVAGSIAVLRAAYPAEALSQTLARLKLSGTSDYDPAAGRSTPRIDLYAAATLGTAVAITATGPATVTAGQTMSYSFTVKDFGPLTATDTTVESWFPPGTTFVSLSSGCAANGTTVTCTVGTLASGGSATLTVEARFNASGAVYVPARVSLDQADTAVSSTGAGTAPPSPPTQGDGPLPPWALPLLALALVGAARRRIALRGGR